MEWDNGVTIGFSGGDDFFHMFNPSTSEVACLNLPHSNFSNVVYRLSSASPEIPPPGIIYRQLCPIQRNIDILLTLCLFFPRKCGSY